ncbi:MAG TPA: single-stranded-DNA-specific exonuclease RecJ, partial [Fodinibius sp.]|nr:single-stranded-DNA-specific exonuclease RecJ [Fodinibius sp.]
KTMSFRWVYSEPDRKETVLTLQQQLGIPKKMALLLSLRGVDSFERAKKYFRPTVSDIHDPFLMQDMHAAADRLARAVRNRERVLVYGDYDVDGTTATSIVYLFLKQFGVNVEFYIPHRFKEGYGINTEGVQYAAKINADLIVSVDCGITAIDEARHAKEQEIDLIICDHHNVGEAIPDALAVLDPKREDCSYPFDGLSGAGVAFKLIQGTVEKLGLAQKMAFDLLDLVAVSTASDIVPMVGENRILMREGLKQINDDPRLGLRSLMDLINLKPGSISTSNIVFSIGPRINAAGRMGDATKAVKLLIAETKAEADSRAHELESINIARRDKDSQTMEEAKAIVDTQYDLDKISSVVLHNPDWHLGVIGIVASRLVDTYGRPAVMLSNVGGKVKGSARSIDGFNIYEAFKQCEDLLEQFGGHKYAAGLTIAKENVDAFRRRMNEISSKSLTKEDFQPDLCIDCELDLSDVNMRFWKLLSQFEPYGPKNLQPVFVSRDVRVVGVPTIVGKGHLKMKVAQNGSGVFDVIGFNMHEYLPVVRNEDKPLNIAYSLEENNWNGRRTLQIRLRDIQAGKENG